MDETERNEDEPDRITFEMAFYSNANFEQFEMLAR